LANSIVLLWNKRVDFMELGPRAERSSRTEYLVGAFGEMAKSIKHLRLLIVPMLASTNFLTPDKQRITRQYGFKFPSTPLTGTFTDFTA
jgi:hypothetical protein